jgi:hypothetical protein
LNMPKKRLDTFVKRLEVSTEDYCRLNLPDVKLVISANPVPVHTAPCSLSISVPKMRPIPLEARIGKKRKPTD